MRGIFSAALGALCVLVPATTLAEGLLYQLPEDGTWVRFDLDVSGSETDGMMVTLVGTLKMSSVGTVDVNGERCRWIEVAIEASANDEPFTQVDKVLIPQKHLAAGKEPLKHVVEAWKKHSMIADGRPREIEDSAGRVARSLESLRPFLHGPFRKVKKLDKVPITTKLGKLECAGIRASEVVDQSRGVTVDTTYTIRLHKKAPFGVVTWEAETTFEKDGDPLGTGTMELKLLDFGKDAKSAIPDAR